MNEGRVRLTTKDNPYDPFIQFDQWYLFDTLEKGYNSSAYIARIINFTDDMSDEEYEAENERAIDEIIANDFLDIYVKVREKK